jgi:hypothetical protein
LDERGFGREQGVCGASRAHEVDESKQVDGRRRRAKQRARRETDGKQPREDRIKRTTCTVSMPSVYRGMGRPHLAL